ncbi:MAG: DUF3604 domain-containing protein [Haliea sp.]|nr:DUF3604 domain-containing protein [Haliea sp.]
MNSSLLATATLTVSLIAPLSVAAADKQLLWGDTHLHTTYSSDAYANGNLTAGPDVAYRYARGMPVLHPYHRARVQIGTPLDFLVVSDHAEFLGGIRSIHRNGVDTSDLGIIDTIKAYVAHYVLTDAIDSGEGRRLFVSMLPDPALTPREDAQAASMQNSDVSMLPLPPEIEIDAWKSITDYADEHYEPGVFTALVGWEWSSIPGGANLHRVVVSDSSGKLAQSYDPFGSDNSPYPEDLWAWLEETSAATGANFIAIPHNSNISKGYMFDTSSFRGEAMTPEYANARVKWEPIAEITQIKGDSETHSTLSPDDEFADFENYPYYIQRIHSEYAPQVGDFVRSALKRGLELEQALGVNPYQLGVIGSTDAHTSLPSAEEDKFHGKVAIDSIPENKLTMPVGDNAYAVGGWDRSASGLAAVWATENTREAILAAMKRKEVYATTGPRIAVQFFGGAGFAADDLSAAHIYDHATSRGVAMGGTLPVSMDEAPSFIATAAKDPVGANLDRLQVIKGWVDAQGQSHERVYNIAWSDDRALSADGKLPPVENTVDMSTGEVDNRVGAETLSAVWTDPDFDAAQSAFYYLRVLQISTARHSLLDAIAMGMDSAEGHPDTIQERAYTSSIWYRP